MRRQRIKGLGAVRRFVRRLPEAAKKEISTELGAGGREFRDIMRARAPRLTGHARAKIGYRALRASLKLKIGYVGGSRQIDRQGLFYARIQDLGRKAQTVWYQRRKRGIRKRLVKNRKPREDLVKDGKFYPMRVRAMAPKRFISGSQREARIKFGQRLLKAFDRAFAIATRDMKT